MKYLVNGLSPNMFDFKNSGKVVVKLPLFILNAVPHNAFTRSAVDW